MKTSGILAEKRHFLHPANRLLLWCMLVICLAGLSFISLLGLTGVLVLSAVWLAPTAMRRSIRRMRWLLLALIVIFAWNTPGVYVTSSWYAPSVEGLYAGIRHSMCLLSVIAGLQITLRGMDQAMLLSACYQLSRPFSWLLGGGRTRFAVRLALTLHYTESWLAAPVSWRTVGPALDAIAQEEQLPERAVNILPFSAADRTISRGIVLLIGLLLARHLWL